MLRIFKVTSIIVLSILVTLAGTTFLYMHQDKFGKPPTGARLDRISKSPNFEAGTFRNQLHTPDLSEGHSMFSVLYNQFFKRHPNKKPPRELPSEKVDLRTLDPNEPVLVWFGHSSFFMQLDGMRILVDPVFSGNASPIPGTVKAYPGTDRYSVADLPEIDVLLISHDHYDHLDHSTIAALQEKTQIVLCGLGVGAHFERWGYRSNQIREQDWNEQLKINSNITIHTLPARHFSGRGLKAKNTLWASYLIESSSLKIYVGGDSGYGPHFANIGEQFGPIDLAFLDNGQYNDAWREIHMFPEDVIRATQELKAKHLFPVHSSKFTLAMHPWDEPLIRISALARTHNISLMTPIIGQKVSLIDSTQTFFDWWEDLQ